MPRHVFTLQLDPAQLDAYRERHAAVWPDMLAALRDSGWGEYTLHLRGDGLLVGVVTTDDLPAAQAAVQATEVNARWQAEMTPFFADLPSGRPDQDVTVLEQIFDIDAQLAAAGQAGAGS